MDDYKSLDEDYVRRLRVAQKSGDKRRVPLIDEDHVRVGRFMTIKQISDDARQFLTREGLGAVRD